MNNIIIIMSALMDKEEHISSVALGRGYMWRLSGNKPVVVWFTLKTDKTHIHTLTHTLTLNVYKHSMCGGPYV